MLAENVRAGTIVALPERLGRKRLVLDDSLVNPAIGVVFAVLEENNTTDGLIRRGHRVFGEAFSSEINAYVRQYLPNPSSTLSDEQKQAMARRIRDKVFSEIHSDAPWTEYFRRDDRFIGFNSVYFPSWALA